jgi:hypothetical protein
MLPSGSERHQVSSLMVSQNWPSDPRDGCKLPFNLVELIQTYLCFEEELEEFEGSFE